jgi:branched-chain amino acid transport system ATP-binding protein
MLELKNIEAGYNKKPVLNDVSINLRKGEIVALIGPNGAGKSTVIKTVMGIVKARKGEIIYKGNSINGNNPVGNIRHGIVYVPQGNTVFSDLTVLENLQMGGYILSDKSIVEDRIKEVFNLFPEIEERKHLDAGNLSGGEKQMLAIGRALMLKPELLLLDEPSLGLAPKSIKKAFEAIKVIRDKFNTTILIVEQKVKEVLEIADRVYVLRLGKVVLEDNAADLKDVSVIKKAFLGE